MRIYLKTITPDDVVSQQDVGFSGLGAALLQKSPLLGLSVEVDAEGEVTEPYHYLYKLAEDGVSIERYPLRRLAAAVSVMKEYTCSKAITDPFSPPSESVTSTTVPTLPNDVDSCFFSKEEKAALLSPIQDCFSSERNDAFKNKDPLVVKSILTTLFSAGFVSHASWKSNLALLLKNQNKLEEIASAVFALHEIGWLTQKTFADVVNHTQPWECASALRYLTHKYPKQIQAIPFIKAKNPDDVLFRGLAHHVQTKLDYLVNSVVSHPFPEESARIIALLYRAFGFQLDLSMVDAITRIRNKSILNILGKTLSLMHQQQFLNKKNYLALLKKSTEHTKIVSGTVTEMKISVRFSRLEHIFDALYHEKLVAARISLTQPLFDCIIAAEDPGVLVDMLSKHSDPAMLTELFKHLVAAGITTKKNVNACSVHANINALAELLKEAVTAGVEINQIIFDVFSSHQNPNVKSAIEVLASSSVGRDFLRKQLKIEEGKFFFGNTEIAPDSLQIQVDGKSIREWLFMTTAMEFEEKTAERIKAIEEAMRLEAHSIASQKEALLQSSIGIIGKSGLFSLRHAQGVPLTGERRHSDAVTPVLQQLVYGNERNKLDSVKTALDAVKNDPNKLRELLCDTSTVSDYSERKITEDTLFKAALRAGDIEMCVMMIPYFDLIPDGERELEIQFLEVFPEGVEEKYFDLEEDSKRDFEPMLQSVKNAILAESDTNLDATLKKEVNNPLYQILETQFRKLFEALSNKEKIFNPYHLLRAFEVYLELDDQLEKDKSDPYHEKRDLFWRQIIGYLQRFMPANYAQAFAQGLLLLVKVYHDDRHLDTFMRSLKFIWDDGSYFPLSSPVDVRSGLGFDFAINFAECCGWTCKRPRNWSQCRDFLKDFVEQKQQDFSSYGRFIHQNYCISSDLKGLKI